MPAPFSFAPLPVFRTMVCFHLLWSSVMGCFWWPGTMQNISMDRLMSSEHRNIWYLRRRKWVVDQRYEGASKEGRYWSGSRRLWWITGWKSHGLTTVTISLRGKTSLDLLYTTIIKTLNVFVWVAMSYWEAIQLLYNQVGRFPSVIKTEHLPWKNLM